MVTTTARVTVTFAPEGRHYVYLLGAPRDMTYGELAAFMAKVALRATKPLEIAGTDTGALVHVSEMPMGNSYEYVVLVPRDVDAATFAEYRRRVIENGAEIPGNSHAFDIATWRAARVADQKAYREAEAERAAKRAAQEAAWDAEAKIREAEREEWRKEHAAREARARQKAEEQRKAEAAREAERRVLAKEYRRQCVNWPLGDVEVSPELFEAVAAEWQRVIW